MPLTKIKRGGLDTGITDNSDANALTFDSSENATFKGEVKIDAPAQAKLHLEADGSGGALLFLQAGNATGDPRVVYETNSSTWSVGLDNSDNDYLVFSNSATPGTNPKFYIEPTQNLSFQNFKVYSATSGADTMLTVKNNVSNADALVIIDSYNDRDAILRFAEATSTKWEFKNDGNASDNLLISNASNTQLKLNQSGSSEFLTGHVYVAGGADRHFIAQVDGDYFPRVQLQRSSGSSKTNRLWSFDLGSNGSLYIEDKTAPRSVIELNTSGNAIFAGAIIQSMSNPYTKLIDTSSGGDDYGLNNNSSKFSIYNWTDGREELYFGGDGNATFGGWVYVNNRIMGASGDVRVGSNDGNEMLHLLADGTAKIDTAGTTALTIDSSQNATFAGEVSVSKDMTVKGTAWNDMFYLGDGTNSKQTVSFTSGSAAFGISTGNSSPKGVLSAYHDGSIIHWGADFGENAFAGKVGMGNAGITSSFEFPVNIDINSSTTQQCGLEVRQHTSGNDARMRFKNADGKYARFGMASNGDFFIEPYDGTYTKRFTMDNDGVTTISTNKSGGYGLFINNSNATGWGLRIAGGADASDYLIHGQNESGVDKFVVDSAGNTVVKGTLTVDDTASIKNTVKISDAQVSSTKVVSPITNSGYTTVKQLDGGYQSGIIILSIYQTNNSAAVRTQIYAFNANYYHRTVSEISDVAGAGAAPKADVRIVRSDNSTSSDGAEPYYVQVQAGNATSIGARVLVLSAR